MPTEQLVATDVRARLFEALHPLVVGVERTAGAAAAEALVIWVRPLPLPGETPGARVVLQTADEVTGGLTSAMPNQAALQAAVNDVLAVALASLGDSAEDAVTMAEQRVAVLLLEARPATGSVRVLLVPKKGKGKVLELGSLVDAPASAH